MSKQPLSFPFFYAHVLSVSPLPGQGNRGEWGRDILIKDSTQSKSQTRLLDRLLNSGRSL